MPTLAEMLSIEDVLRLVSVCKHQRHPIQALENKLLDKVNGAEDD